VALDPKEVASLEIETFKKRVREKAAQAYDEKETEYPVMAGLYHFTTRDRERPEALRPRKARGLGPRAV